MDAFYALIPNELRAVMNERLGGELVSEFAQQLQQVEREAALQHYRMLILEIAKLASLDIKKTQFPDEDHEAKLPAHFADWVNKQTQDELDKLFLLDRAELYKTIKSRSAGMAPTLGKMGDHKPERSGH